MYHGQKTILHWFYFIEMIRVIINLFLHAKKGKHALTVRQWNEA